MAPSNDMIKNRRNTNRRPAGGPRRASLGVQTGKNFARQTLMVSGIEMGTKLYLSNLNYRVTNEDIKRLFSAVGKVLRYDINYDRNGRPGGTAEVLYARKSDALEALKKYHNVHLDGRPMKIDLITNTTNSQPRVPVSACITPRAVTNTGSNRVNTGMTRTVPVNRRGFRGGRGGHRQGGGKKKAVVVKSAEDLDKELDAYHANVAMES